MATTGSPWNLPYPLPTDLVRDGADAIKDLAEGTASALTSSANNLNASNLVSGTVPLARLPYQAAGGQVTGNVPSNTISSTTVTFPSGRFTAAPDVVATKHGSSDMARNFELAVGVNTATTTSFTITRANNNQSSSRIITANWVAIQS